MSDDKKDPATTPPAPWPPTELVQATPRDGVGITKLNTEGSAGEEGLLSKEPDANGWFIGHIPGYNLQIGVREMKESDRSWWEAKVGTEVRPYCYLNRTAAQQGALSELQRLWITRK